MREDFSCRCSRSTSPLEAGWYAVVRIRVVPSWVARAWKRRDSNWRPLSVVMVEGAPKRATQWVTKIRATVSAVMGSHVYWQYRPVRPLRLPVSIDLPAVPRQVFFIARCSKAYLMEGGGRSRWYAVCNLSGQNGRFGLNPSSKTYQGGSWCDDLPCIFDI